MAENVKFWQLPKAYALGMKEQSKYKWWKPLVALLLSFALFIGFVVVIAILVMVVAVAVYSMAGADQATIATSSLMDYSSDSYIGVDGNDPIGLAIVFLSVIIMLPCVGLANKIMGLGGFGRLSSVEGKLRWKRLFTYLLWALLVVVVVDAIEIALGVFIGGEELPEMRFALPAIIVIIIMCPLQCAAEEYVCRGFFMQMFGSWIPLVIIPMILQALIFMVMHGYDELGLASVLVTGLVAGFLTLKTGGLEAGISMHTANNVISFIISAIFVGAETTSEVSIEGFVMSVVVDLLFLVVLYQVSKRKGYLLDKDFKTPAMLAKEAALKASADAAVAAMGAEAGAPADAEVVAASTDAASAATDESAADE